MLHCKISDPGRTSSAMVDQKPLQRRCSMHIEDAVAHGCDSNIDWNLLQKRRGITLISFKKVFLRIFVDFVLFYDDE